MPKGKSARLRMHSCVLGENMSNFSFIALKFRDILTHVGGVAHSELRTVCAQGGFCQTKKRRWHLLKRWNEPRKCLKCDEEHVPVNRAPGVQQNGEDIQISSTACLRNQSNNKKIYNVSLFILSGFFVLFTITKLRIEILSFDPRFILMDFKMFNLFFSKWIQLHKLW